MTESEKYANINEAEDFIIKYLHDCYSDKSNHNDFDYEYHIVNSLISDALFDFNNLHDNEELDVSYLVLSDYLMDVREPIRDFKLEIMLIGLHVHCDVCIDLNKCVRENKLKNLL